jgi:hypothetical protein
MKFTRISTIRLYRIFLTEDRQNYDEMEALCGAATVQV